MKHNIELIAYYLPQYHRIKFNDDYWGKGFTEWTNTAKAKPLFKGHYQPHIPADLGFYDLSVPSIRREQAQLAIEYGISAFCYWHYWLGKNQEIMDMPFKEVLKDKEITLPFCLAWANHDWHNVKTREIIVKQDYGGIDDYQTHYKSLYPAFKDDRYYKIDNKPLFAIFSPFEIPDAHEFISCWNKLAKDDGFNGIYFIAIVKRDNEIDKALKLGFDAINTMRLQEFEFHRKKINIFIDYIKHIFLKRPYVYSYAKAMKYFLSNYDKKENIIPTIISGWDHTPRSGNRALVLNNYTPKTFSKHVDDAIRHVENKRNKIVFIRAWNEWAEGNHLEPDLRFGLKFLQVLKDKLYAHGN
ncbi:MAG: glycoside hydrolase family 99-like domain-containing protein [Bacteroidaceae bacterium]|nr:glycoside hydrolase family 99-like domain-containing protein [Bacteroidaceae bacterium]